MNLKNNEFEVANSGKKAIGSKPAQTLHRDSFEENADYEEAKAEPQPEHEQVALEQAPAKGGGRKCPI